MTYKKKKRNLIKVAKNAQNIPRGSLTEKPNYEFFAFGLEPSPSRKATRGQAGWRGGRERGEILTTRPFGPMGFLHPALPMKTVDENLGYMAPWTRGQGVSGCWAGTRCWQLAGGTGWQFAVNRDGWDRSLVLPVLPSSSDYHH